MSRIAWLVIALVLIAPVLPAQRKHKAPVKHHATKKPVGELRSDLAKVRRKKMQLKAELRKTKRQAGAVLADIQVVDNRLSSLEDKLAETSDRLSESRRDQRNTAIELDRATAKLDQTREQVRERMKQMYMQGDASLVSALIGVKTVGDIASREMIMSRVADKDRQMFTDYRDLRAQVADHKQHIDHLVERVRSLKADQEHQQAELQDARDEKKGYLHELNQKVGELQELVSQFEQDEQEIASQIQAYDSSRGRRPVLPPFTGRLSRPINARMTSGFGMRYHPILHITRLHAGVDFGAPIGTIIHAAADGVVIATRQMRSAGNVVMIDHGGGLSTVYMHCSRFLVASGQRVSRGDPIAAVGNTGLSTGPHLHFEVRINGLPVNPLGKL